MMYYLVQKSAKLLKSLHGNLHKSFILCCKICQSITLICSDVATRVIELCLVLVENNPCLCLGFLSLILSKYFKGSLSHINCAIELLNSSRP